jgi:SAM-dependent methyltransferase
MSYLSNFQLYPIANPQKLLDYCAVKSTFSIGQCPVCGSPSIFLKFEENLRESGSCIVCRSRNRQRQIAQTFLGAIYESTGINTKSIGEFAKKSLSSRYLKKHNLQIYNTETTGSIHNVLKNLDNYVASEYLGDNYKSGELVEGILHQNLMETSFATSSLDIVMSSDVFEHIPDPYKAFAEIYRILKPRGRHIFTLPFYGDRYRDEIRATVNLDGTLNHILPPIYHGDPIRPEGILVYVIFSMEMLMKLDEIGFEVRMYNMRNPIKGILGNNAIVFDAIKIG